MSKQKEVLYDLKSFRNLKEAVYKVFNEYEQIKNVQKENDKNNHPAKSLGFGDKKYGLECLADPYIFNSLREFQDSVECGGIINDDGCGCLLYVNKHTFQLEERDSCWRVNWNDPIEKIIKDNSDEDRQLLAVMWYNK